jgi:hypothetical protein
MEAVAAAAGERVAALVAAASAGLRRVGAWTGLVGGRTEEEPPAEPPAEDGMAAVALRGAIRVGALKPWNGPEALDEGVLRTTQGRLRAELAGARLGKALCAVPAAVAEHTTALAAAAAVPGVAPDAGPRDTARDAAGPGAAGGGAGESGPAAWAAAIGGLVGALEAVASCVGAGGAEWASWLAGRTVLEALDSDLPAWLRDAATAGFPSLTRWRTYGEALAGLDAAGSGDLARAVLAGEAASKDLPGLAEQRGWQRQAGRHAGAGGALGADPAADLRVRAGLGALETERRSLLPGQVDWAIDAAARSGRPAAATEALWADLRRSRNQPVHRLVRRHTDAVLGLLLITLVTPDQVARLFPAGRWWDVVVVEEASQVPPGQAVGALGRAGSAVVVGDLKQMPPVDRFRARAEDIDLDGDAAEVRESLLDECSDARIGVVRLTTPYRARNPVLLEFSNTHWYGGSLASLPGAPGWGGESLRRIRVEGVWDGRRRVNRAEAAAAVDQAREAAGGSDSVMVVTMNAPQRDLVKTLALDAGLELTEGSPAAGAVTVKNLDRVQGDAADVVVLCTNGSLDPVTGAAPTAWGPLAHRGGDRRLNVALTRARRRLVVVTSLDSRPLAATAPRSRGVKLLAALLARCEAVDGWGIAQRAALPDPLRDDLARRLGGLGFDAVPLTVGAQARALAVRRRGDARSGNRAGGWQAVVIDSDLSSSPLDLSLVVAPALRKRGWDGAAGIGAAAYVADPAGAAQRLAAALGGGLAVRPVPLDRAEPRVEGVGQARQRVPGGD